MFLALSSKKIKAMFKLYLSINYSQISEKWFRYFPNDLDKF
jgi:hypothetical protein